MRASEILGEDVFSQVDDLFEMANLRQKQTGIPGTIYISTQQASHGPRVKYYVDRPGSGVASFSVSIAPEPQVVENSLSSKIVNQMSPLVIEWVGLNHESLMNFWTNGTTWFDNEVQAFKASLTKVVSKRRK
jgi:hypothetical protein